MDRKTKLLALATQAGSLIKLIETEGQYGRMGVGILHDLRGKYISLLSKVNLVDSEINGLVEDVGSVNFKDMSESLSAFSALKEILKLAAYDGIDVESLIKENKQLKTQIEELTATVNKLINTDDMKADETFLASLPMPFKERIIEAYLCFKHGAYIATCILCGTVMEGLIIDKTRNVGQTFEDLNARIEFLKENKIINPKETGKLTDVMKEYRDHSAHPTSTVFDKPKAALFINSLILLTRELMFKK